MDYLNNWIHQQLPKPIPIYGNLQVPCQESVIKSTSEFLPKCNSPTIVCQPSSEVQTNLPEVSSSKSTSSRRLSYSREYKLLVIYYFLTHGQKNKYRTCKQFRITKSMLNGWLQKAEKIFNSRQGAKKTGSSGRKPQFSEIEEKLYQLYLERNSQGYEIENRWLKEKAKELASDNPPQKPYQFSERWLNNFKRRYNIPTILE